MKFKSFKIVKNMFADKYFSEEREESGAGSVGSGIVPGRPKTYGSYGFESGSGTLVLTLLSAVKQISGMKHVFSVRNGSPYHPNHAYPRPAPTSLPSTAPFTVRSLFIEVHL
jgi:hypothetical protein